MRLHGLLDGRASSARSTRTWRSKSATSATATRSRGTTEDWNDENFVENGLQDEFKLAQANLLANVAAGRGGTFAYFGPGTGTQPLPIFLAHFAGLPASQAGNPANYTVAAYANDAQFTNSTWVDDLDPLFADPIGIADELYGRQQRHLARPTAAPRACRRTSGS